jgi:membrane fusion protein (multidrug efflux system)
MTLSANRNATALPKYSVWFAVALSAALVTAGCTSPAQSQTGAQPPPPPVEVISVSAQDVPIDSEFSAQTFARDRVEVRGRVNGYIEKWLFRPGAQVRAGQVLYTLDARPFEAAVEQASGSVRETEGDVQFARNQVSLLQAQANLAAAEASLVKAQQDVERLKPLVEQDAAAKQDLDAANAALRSAEANVRANKANVEQAGLSTKTQIQSSQGKLESLRGALRNAQLNLQYATIRAPISGVIGDTQVPVGGIVSSSSPLPLTTIVPLDPIWVRFQMSESQYLAYGRQKQTTGKDVPIELVLADGTVFPVKGKIDAVLNQVDPQTGTLELQAKFQNPDSKLLPGQFGRVRFRTDERTNVILVPQRAVQQMQNVQTVFTVDSNNKVEARAVKTLERVGEDWIIGQGLRSGDKVIVEGQLRIRPGMPVSPSPFQPENKRASR